jgi:hypothetical protein
LRAPPGAEVIALSRDLPQLLQRVSRERQIVAGAPLGKLNEPRRLVLFRELCEIVAADLDGLGAAVLKQQRQDLAEFVPLLLAKSIFEKRVPRQVDVIDLIEIRTGDGFAELGREPGRILLIGVLNKLRRISSLPSIISEPIIAL